MKKIILILVLIVGLIFLYIFGASILTKINTTYPVWIEDIKLSSINKEEAITLIDEVAVSYLLHKETVDGPSNLKGQSVHFYHYKIDDSVVMTVYDLKGGSDTLTIYFYGLEGVSNTALSSDIRSLLNQFVDR